MPPFCNSSLYPSTLRHLSIASPSQTRYNRHRKGLFIMKGFETIIEKRRDSILRNSLLSDEFINFVQKNKRPFDEMMSYYKCAIMEVETKFRVLNEQYSLEYDRNPIEDIKSRTKSMESLMRKIRRKDIPLTVASIEENIHDIAGVRVICSFPDDIYMLADCLLSQDDITLIKKKDCRSTTPYHSHGFLGKSGAQAPLQKRYPGRSGTLSGRRNDGMCQHQCFSGRTHATCKGCSEQNLQRCIFIKTIFSSLDILKRRTIMTVINNQMRRTGQRFSFTCVYRESSVGVRRHHRNKKLSPASSLNQHKLHVASNSGRRSTVTGMLIQRMRQRGRLFRQEKWYREGLSLRLLMDNP